MRSEFGPSVISIPTVLIPLAAVVALTSLIASPSAAFPEWSGPNMEFSSLGDGSFVLSDLTGDQWPDLAAVDDRTGYVRLYVGGINGLPREPETAAFAPNVRALAVADLDRDGRQELLAVDGQNALRFDPEGLFRSVDLFPAPGGHGIQAGDLNGDGREDLVVLGTTGATVRFQTPDGEFHASPDMILSANTGFDDLAVGDVNGDVRDDVVLARAYEMHLYVQGPLILDPAYQPLAIPGSGGPASVGLLEGGDLPFLVCVTAAISGTESYAGLWTWTDGSLAPYATLQGVHTGRLAVGDANDDHWPDLALGELDGSVAVFLQRDGAFAADAPDVILSGSPVSGGRVAIGDVNGDGFGDLVYRVPGKFLVFLQEDALPVLIRAIPDDQSVNRASVVRSAIDLREYFRDDHNRLTFSLALASDPANLTGKIEGSVLGFEAADWYGTARFRVTAWDGSPNHAPVESNVFSVLVNDPPTVTSSPSLRAKVGEQYVYAVAVADAFPVADPHAFHLLESPDGMTIDAATGVVTWTPEDEQVGEHPTLVEARDASGGAAAQRFSVVVSPRDSASPVPVMAVSIVATSAALMAAAALLNENAKFAFFLLFVPLYTKIKRERVLDHFVRGQIYGYIQANPGEHYNAIKDALGLTNGSLAHHLRTLEREQFVKSKRFGLYRRFYPMNFRIPADDAYQPNEIQRTILAVIRGHPGITQKDIAGRLGLTPPTVNYHVAALSERNLIRVERRGRSTHCSVVEAGLT